MKKVIILSFAFLNISFAIAQSINGPGTVEKNITYTYSWSSGIYQLGGVIWEVTGGTIVSTNFDEGTVTYSANIKFTSTGSQTITLKNGFTQNAFQTKSVNVYVPLSAGSIGNAQTVCYGGNPSTISNSQSASGGTGSISYQWQHRPLGGSFSNISGATGSTYNPPSLTSSKEYRRRASSGSETKYTNIIRITVNPNLNPGSISGGLLFGQILCYNEDAPGLGNSSSATGGNGSYSYQWQWRSPGGSWSNISGATGTSYNPGGLTSDKEFRRRVSSCSQTKYSNIITYEVHPNLNAGSIKSSQTICSNVTPSNFGNNSSASGGDGNYSYQWQRRVPGGSWSNISGATSTGYNPGTTSTTYEYRRRVQSCSQTKYTGTVTVTRSSNLSAGSINGSKTICYNSSGGTLGNSSSPSGGDGSYTYQWQYYSGGWNNVTIGGSNSTLSLGNHTSTTKYRRRVQSCGQTDYSNEVTITVRPALSAGGIGSNKTICYNDGTTINAGSASGGNGSYTYTWQIRDPGGSWSNISSSNSEDFSTGNLTSTKDYRRKVYSCGETKYSSYIRVTVRASLTAGSINGNQTLCSNQSASILGNASSPTGGDGNYNYQWQRRIPGNSWSNISGATSSTYSPGTSSTTYDFRRRVQSCGETKYTDYVTVTRTGDLNAGSINGAKTICYGASAGTMGNSSSPSGGDGNYSYQWQLSVNNSSWINISGATGSTYSPGDLTSTAYYRRKVTSCGQTAYTSSMKVTVRPSLTAGGIGSNKTICYNSETTISAGSATGGNGNYTYTWQIRNPGGSWSNISNSNVEDYNTDNLTNSKEFRRKVTSCGQTKYSSDIRVNVNPNLNAGSISGSQMLCSTEDPSTITSSSDASGGNGSYSYQWRRRDPNGGEWSTISGATNKSYNPPMLSNTYEYQRRVTSCGQTKDSNIITITIQDLDPGSISGVQTLCYNENAAQINNSESPSGPVGVYSMFWQYSFDGNNWVDITNSDQLDFDPDNLTQSTYYRRATSVCNQTKFTEPILITVHPQLTAGSTGSDKTICYNSGTTINAASAGGGDGSYTYQWQHRNINGQWSDITGATSEDLSLTSLTSTKEYQRIAVSCGQTKYSSEVKVTVRPDLNQGSISGSQVLCSTQTPNQLMSTENASGGNNSYNYQWYRKSDSGNWTEINGATNVDYSPNAESVTYDYKREVSSCGQTKASNTISVIIMDLTAGSISGGETVCYNENVAQIDNQENASGPVSQSYAYNWQYSHDQTNWTDIPGADSDSYDPPGTLDQTTYYRREISGCGQTKHTNQITVNVNPEVDPGDIGTNEDLCTSKNYSFAQQNEAQALYGNPTIDYVWEYVDAETVDGSTVWNTISNSNTAEYSMTTSSSKITRWYRRGASTGDCDWSYSDPVRVNTYYPMEPGTISGSTDFCESESLYLTFSPPQHTNSFAYWEKKPEGGSWSPIPNGSGGNLAATNPVDELTTDGTQYRVRTPDFYCSQDALSNVLTISVNPSISAGSIGNDVNLCEHEAFSWTQNTPATSDDPIIYLWKISSNGTDWSNVPDSDHQHIDPVLDEPGTYWYKRGAYHNGCISSIKYTSPVKITLTQTIYAGTIVGDTSICNGETIELTHTPSDLIEPFQGNLIWQQNTGSGWVDVLDGSSNTIPSSEILTIPVIDGAQYRVIHPSSTICTADIVPFTVNELPLVDAGTLSGDESLCINEPVNFTQTQASVSGGHTLTYVWQYADTDQVDQSTQWTDISNSNSETYATTTTTAGARWYRRGVFISDCDTVFTAAVKKITKEPYGIGTISGVSEFCTAHSLNLSYSPPATPNSFSIWQKRMENGSWVDLHSVSTGITETAMDGIWYRVMSPDNVCGDQFSDSVLLNVKPVLNAGSINPDDKYCSTSLVTWNETPASSEDIFNYVWQYSEDGSNWISLENSDTASIDIDSMSFSSRWFRRGAFYGGCDTLFTGAKEITIDLTGNLGSLQTTQEIFEEEANVVITMTGNEGNVVEWQKMTDGTNWTSISGTAGQQNYQVTNLTGPAIFRAITECSSSFGPMQKIIVRQKVSGMEEVYGTANSGTLTVPSDNGFMQWQSSTDAKTWVNIPNANDSSCNYENIAKDTYFRVKYTVFSEEYYSDAFHVIVWPAVGIADETKNYRKVIALDTIITDTAEVNNLSNHSKTVAYSYFDGMGRTKQSVVKNITPNQSDIVSFTEYDQNGRSLRKYLPYIASGSDYYQDVLTAQSNYYQSPGIGVASSTKPFAESELDARSRVVKQGAPGESWQPDQNPVTYGYGFNDTNVVRKWNEDGISSGYYAANQLVKNEVTDENGNMVRTYTDTRGLQILKEVQDGPSSFAKTYRIYDEMGKLLFVVPPKAVKEMEEASNFEVSSVDSLDLVFKYFYDAKGRLITQKIPGKNKDYLVYDPLDRVALTQTPKLREDNLWKFTKYDQKGRPSMMGSTMQEPLIHKLPCRQYWMHWTTPMATTTLKK